MLREMKLSKTPTRSLNKSSSSRKNINVTNNKLKSSDRLENSAGCNNIEKMSSTSESTFYKTLRNHNSDREDPITENIKYFVNNSPSLKKFEPAPVKDFSNVVFSSKDYLRGNDNANLILNSIYNESKFKRIQAKKRDMRSKSGTNFFNYNKDICEVDNMKEFEGLVSHLKIEVYDRLHREINEKTRMKEELENNVSILANRVNLTNSRLSSCKSSNTDTLQETTKLEFYSDRLGRENYTMDMEIPITKKRIENMKNEVFEKDKETRQLKYEIMREESEVNFLQEETKRLSKRVLELQNEKKNLMSNVVMMKKQTDMLKEKVIKEDNKNKTFVSEVSELLQRSKIGY